MYFLVSVGKGPPSGDWAPRKDHGITRNKRFGQIQIDLVEPFRPSSKRTRLYHPHSFCRIVVIDSTSCSEVDGQAEVLEVETRRTERGGAENAEDRREE